MTREIVELAKIRNREMYPNVPEYARPLPRYTDKTANGLTQCILDWLNFNGWQAERISIQGRLLDNRKVVTNTLGQRREIGSTKWVPGQMTPGTADISATINGRSVKIEVKIGKDRLSPAQIKYGKKVTRAGGIYYVARTWASFLKWYNETFDIIR